MGILRTRLGRVLESAEGPPEVTQGSTPGPKVSMRKDRFKVTEPGPGKRQMQKPGKQSVPRKIIWKEFRRKGRRGMVQNEEAAYKGVNPSKGTVHTRSETISSAQPQSKQFYPKVLGPTI